MIVVGWVNLLKFLDSILGYLNHHWQANLNTGIKFYGHTGKGGCGSDSHLSLISVHCLLTPLEKGMNLHFPLFFPIVIYLDRNTFKERHNFFSLMLSLFTR